MNKEIKTAVEAKLSSLFDLDEGVFRTKSTRSGYWSNLNKDENQNFMKAVKKLGPAEAVKQIYPRLYDVIFSKKREAGLELLQLKGDELCIDYGCMWGALSIPLARRANHVISVDQTPESLQFLASRIEEEKIENITLVNEDVKHFPVLPEEIKADCAVVNGVLEWVPESGVIELKEYYGKKRKKNYDDGYKPEKVQLEFLKSIKDNLGYNGKLYLAIENRYDFKMFFGVKDPHANLYFTTILPKFLANFISKAFLSRPYVTHIHSKKELRTLLQRAGFSEVEFYYAFPDYRFPELIKHEDTTLSDFKPTISIRQDGHIKIKRLIGFILEFSIFRLLKLKSLVPSYIVIAKK
jgi:ubiquinone/menaquinone biosynthesis C-methylase UbiE